MGIFGVSMAIVLGGLLENAMIRKYDAEENPSRNTTDHPYYISLNRNVPSAVQSRCDTFLTIADAISIPTVDWNPAYGNDKLLNFVQAVEVEGDRDVLPLAKVLIANHAFSPETYKAISRVDTSSAKRKTGKESAVALRRAAAQMYVERLLLQARLAGASHNTLALTATEIDVLVEIGEFILLHNVPTPFEIPDLTTNSVVNADTLGILADFTAIDLAQLNAVRNDSIIRDYAVEVTRALSSTSIKNTERDLINAMRQARKDKRFVSRYDTGFEVFSIATKPLQYIPAISTGITIANDIVSVFRKWLDRKSAHVDWHLIGARMQEIKIEEYLSRKHNTN